MKPLKRIIVTGGAGQVAYSFLPSLIRGDVFGLDQPIALHLLDLPEMQGRLEGVAMELEDCASALLREIKVGCDAVELFSGVDFAFFLGAKPRTAGVERKNLLLGNGKIFAEQGEIFDQTASLHAKALVIGNPCNTNCLILLHRAHRLSPKRFFALTLLDQNRARCQLALHARTNVENVAHVITWGNHSATQAVDFLNATINGAPVTDVIGDRRWLEKDFSDTVCNRAGEVIRLRGKSSGLSAANAMIDAVHAIMEPTKTDGRFSMGVYSSGNPYGVDNDLVFSFPCRSNGQGDVEIVPHLQLDPFLKKKIAAAQRELIEERAMAAQL